MSDLAIYIADSTATKRRINPIVRRAYQNAYNTTPKPADVYAVVLKDGQIAGCIGIDEAGPGGRFMIERIYDVQRDSMPLPINARNTVQFGRLVALERGIVPFILYAGATYAAQAGKVYGIIDHTDAVHRIIAHQGLVFWGVPTATINLGIIAPEDQAFYAHKKPKPYLIKIGQAQDATLRHLDPEPRIVSSIN